MRFLAIIEVRVSGSVYGVGGKFQDWLNAQQMILDEYGTPRLVTPECTGIIYEDLTMVAYNLRDAADRLQKALSLEDGEIDPKPPARKRTARKRSKSK